MLILGRRVGQGIRIGDSIRISVMAVDGQFVRLGFEAPASRLALIRANAGKALRFHRTAKRELARRG